MKIDLFLKDFKLMLEEGRRLGVPLPLTSVTQQLVTATAAAGRGEEDLAAIFTTLEKLAGLEKDRSSEKKN
jgi:3-hydroxyisobutyrate dehydrogenase-like beta-hydroxyacid dehydrogenase